MVCITETESVYCAVRTVSLNIIQVNLRQSRPCHSSGRQSPASHRGGPGSIPVAVLSKAWVCGRSLTGNVGSNPAEGMDVCVVFIV